MPKEEDQLCSRFSTKGDQKKNNEIITKEVAKANATHLLDLFTSEVLQEKINKEVSAIYPVRNIRIRKVKVIQRPKVDSTKLAEMHDNERRILSKAENKRNLKGDRKGAAATNAPKTGDQEAVNLLSRE